MKPKLKTTKAIVERIGAERFAQMLGRGEKSVSRAVSINRFTAAWYLPIKEELAELDEQEPDVALFNFKARIPKGS